MTNDLNPAGVEAAGVYIASKVKHAARWRFLRDQVGEPIISTWIDEAGEGESQDLADLWRRCIAEASRAAVLILYREAGETLKGGWVELGAALASGAKIFAIGIEEFTVSKDARITLVPDMKAAIAASRTYLSTASLPQPEGETATCKEILQVQSEETADLVERLQPRWSVDEEVSRAVWSDDLAVRREALSRFLVANNALKREAADAITSLSQRLAVANEEIAGCERLTVAQNGIVNQVWDILGRDETREGGQNLVGRVKELADALQAAEAQLAHARDAAIEECAKVADEHAETWGAAMASPAIVIAAAIRAMKGA